MGNPVEIKALFFALIRGSPGAEIVFLYVLASETSPASMTCAAYAPATQRRGGDSQPVPPHRPLERIGAHATVRARR